MTNLGPSQRPLLWSGRGWSPIETKDFLRRDRDWTSVQLFYRRLVLGETSLEQLGVRSGEEAILGKGWEPKLRDFNQRIARNNESVIHEHKRTTYKVCLSYYGDDFEGWAYNTGLHTVEGVLFTTLQGQLGLKNLVLSSAGRTDKGVSA